MPAPQRLVLIDTCIWVPFFNRPQSVEKKLVTELLDADRAAIIGPILAEILQGFRRDEQADWVVAGDALSGIELGSLEGRCKTGAATRKPRTPPAAQ